MSLRDLDAQRIVVAIAIFCLVVGVGVWLLSSFQKRLKRDLSTTDSCDPRELLGTFREAFEEGEMDAAEFEKVRQVLAREEPSGSMFRLPSPSAESSDPLDSTG
ncbi:MAG: hypothetical protein NVSMB14_03750 [Isosphaeraceae bacterium]